MNITPELVKELRIKSGAGMMDCKKALAEAEGDLSKAQDTLRKWGLASVGKRAGRVASEGLIGYNSDSSSSSGVLIEVNCETDFVARNEDFRGFVKNLVGLIEKNDIADLESLMNAKIGSTTVETALNSLIAKIGEKLTVRRFAKEGAKSEQKLAKYIHVGDKIGVMVLFSDPNGKLADDVARDVAMHIAAMRPRYVRSADVPEAEVEKEREIIAAQMKQENKPADILAKIIDGKLKRYYSEVCLEDQLFVRDPDGKASVGKWLAKIDNSIRIEKFVRYEVGEGL